MTRPIDYSIIIELAEYIKGNRGDASGYLASFFYRCPGNCYNCLDGIDVHANLKGIEYRTRRLLIEDPKKKRTMNFYRSA